MSNTRDTQANWTKIPCDEDNVGFNGKNYVFVKNNPDNDRWSLVPSTALAQLSKFLNSDNEKEDNCILWGAVSVERGSERGTKHLQGYFQLKKKTRFTVLCKRLKEAKLWMRPAKGDAKENDEYISHTGKWANKAGDLLEGPYYLGGEPSNEGSRNDLKSLSKSLKAGKSIRYLVNNHTETMLRYFGNATKIQSVLEESNERNWMTELYIYTGVAGSGKSHAAYREAIKFLSDEGIDEKPYMLMVPAKGEQLWWENYDGHSVVIIDDFYGTIGLDYFKRLIDKYPMRVNIKNRSANFLARRVYITSNQGWRSWWGSELLSNRENENAIMRRITVDKHFDTVYNASGAIANTNAHDLDRRVNRDIIEVLSDDDSTSAPVRSYANQGLTNNHMDVFDQPPEWSTVTTRTPVGRRTTLTRANSLADDPFMLSAEAQDRWDNFESELANEFPAEI